MGAVRSILNAEHFQLKGFTVKFSFRDYSSTTIQTTPPREERRGDISIEFWQSQLVFLTCVRNALQFLHKMTMTGFSRTLEYLAGRPVDRPPFHPIIMRWAARYSGVKYRDFCLVPKQKCRAMIRCADDFDLDWVTVMSDPFAEASAFGLDVDYPEDNLPIDRSGHLAGPEAALRLQPYDPVANDRTRNRLEEIRQFRKDVGGRYFIVGWVEGPIAAYAALRGAANAAMDLLDAPDAVRTGCGGCGHFCNRRFSTGIHNLAD